MDYAYDGRGNRSQMTVTGTDRYTVQYTYDANNRLTQEEKTRGVQTGLITYTYDPNGNLTQRMELGCDGSPSAASFIYDVFGQQATATYNGATTAYTYNAQGIRVAKTTAGSRTDFLLDGGNVAAEQTDGDITTYLRGVNLIARSDGGTTEYYLYNAHGDVVQRTDSSGAVTKAYSYDAFGVEQNPDSTDPNPFSYCGEYFDCETGTYYLRARYYSPGTGRFTQEDPSCDGLNWYSYCGCDPLNYLDPTGCKKHWLLTLREYIDGNFLLPMGESIPKSILTNANYQWNSKYEFNGYIDDQLAGNAALVRMGTMGSPVGFGFCCDGFNACGWVAVYNAFLTLGTSVHPVDIISFFENNGGLTFDGIFGSSPHIFEQIFESYGYEAMIFYTYSDVLDGILKDGRTGILSYINSGGITEGAHNVNITWDAEQGVYIIHNLSNDDKLYYKTLDEFIATKGVEFLALTVVMYPCSTNIGGTKWNNSTSAMLY